MVHHPYFLLLVVRVLLMKIFMSGDSIHYNNIPFASFDDKTAQPFQIY
jgi:hypothetical protein